VLHGLTIDQLHRQRLDITITADFKADLAAGRNIAEHAAQCIGVGDILAIDGEDDIVDLEPDLPAGAS